MTLHINNILCKNEISYLFIAPYDGNFHQGILHITWRWPNWPKHVVKYAKPLTTIKRFVVTDGLLHCTVCIITTGCLKAANEGVVCVSVSITMIW